MNSARSVFASLIVCAMASFAAAGEWITAPSYFTHDPNTGERVNQYSPIGPVYVYPRADYQQSGFRYIENNLSVGGASDRLHIVEEWGNPVRPYGEWQFPYRPYSVPYSQWGPPYGGLGYPAYYQGGAGGPGGPGIGGPGYGGPGPGPGPGPGYGGPGYGNGGPGYGNGPNGPGNPHAPGF